MPTKRNHPPDYEQHLLQALEDLKQDPTLSIAKADAHRAVPPSTLRDRKNRGMQNPTAAHQHDCLLSSTQEDILVRWALFQDDMGIPPHQELLKEKAEAILHPNNPNERIGKRWVDRFMKHNQELKSRFSKKLNNQRQALGNPNLMKSN